MTWKAPSTTMQTAANAIQPTQGEALGYLWADGVASASGIRLGAHHAVPSERVVVAHDARGPAHRLHPPRMMPLPGRDGRAHP